METKTYKIGKMKQLIDLNGDTVNFNIDFNVKSEKGEPFDMLVIDQTTLDNTANIEYKKVENGEISGNITQQQNAYQNYFLILKADKENICTVSINKRELPVNDNFEKNLIREVNSKDTQQHKNSSETNYVKYILIAIIISIGLYFMYSFWKKSKKPTVNFTKPVFINHMKSSSRTISQESIRSPKVELSKPIELSKPTELSSNPILDRLKKLKI